jgi:hypothetical protein
MLILKENRRIENVKVVKTYKFSQRNFKLFNATLHDIISIFLSTSNQNNNKTYAAHDKGTRLQDLISHATLNK